MAAVWEAVASKIRGQIQNETLAPGAQLTPEAELATEEGVSRATVRRALQELATEGLITSGRGRLGRRVRESATLLTWELSEFERGDRRDTHEADDWISSVQEQGFSAHQTVEVSIDAAGSDTARALRLAVGDLVVTRHRTRYANDAPYQLSTSAFPRDIAAGTQLEVPGDQSVPGGILASIGYPQAYWRDSIRARMPSASELERLQIPHGVPVISHMRVGYSEADRPIRVMSTISPADRWELAYGMAVTA